MGEAERWGIKEFEEGEGSGDIHLRELICNRNAKGFEMEI